MANYHPLMIVNRLNESALDKLSVSKIVEIQERETDLWLIDEELDDQFTNTKLSLKQNFGDIISDMEKQGFTEQEALKKIKLIAFRK